MMPQGKIVSAGCGQFRRMRQCERLDPSMSYFCRTSLVRPSPFPH